MKKRKLFFLICVFSILFASKPVFARNIEEANRTELFTEYTKVLFTNYKPYQVKYNWKPAEKRTYLFTSSNPKVATVNSKGLIHPISSGKTVIRADYVKNNRKYYGSISITVRNPYVFIKNKISKLPVGENYVFKTNIGGSDSGSGDFEWTVSDENIGTITTGNRTATFTAKKEGQVKIEVRDKNTGGTSSCVVHVVSNEAPFGIRNIVDELWWDVDYKFYTQGTKNKVKWEVSDPSIATITDDGVITGLKGGDVTVSVTDEETKEKKSYPITIKWIPETPIEKFEYREIEGKIQIETLKDKSITEVRIPEEANGKPVIYDEDAWSFFFGDQVKTLVIPKSVDLSNKLEMGVGGNSLESVVVLNRDTEVCLHYSMSGVPNIKEYIVPYNCKMWLVDNVGDGNFYGLKTLKKLNFSETIVWENEYGEGAEAFSVCENMEIVIPPTVTELKALCDNCKNMRIVIPSSVTKISKETFKDCKKSEITIVTPKGSYAEQYAKENGYSYEYYYE